MKRVNVRIFPDGRIEAETHGIKGKECTEYIRVLEELMEAETVDSSYTSEYYETEHLAQESIRQHDLREDN